MYVKTDKVTYQEWLKEIEQLKEKLALTENDRDEWEVKAKDLLKENKKLKEELEKLMKPVDMIYEEGLYD